MAALWTARMGERMRSRRTELGMSRSDLAERITGKTDANASMFACGISRLGSRPKRP